MVVYRPLSVRVRFGTRQWLCSAGSPATLDTLRHTFALGYLRDNPGKLVELASMLGHDSLDTTAVYTRPSRDDLAADLERSHLTAPSGKSPLPSPCATPCAPAEDHSPRPSAADSLTCVGIAERRSSSPIIPAVVIPAVVELCGGSAKCGEETKS
jgi:hypothetical protein